MKKLRAILLEAVSSDAQAASSEVSLPEQDFRLHEVAERRDWEIIDIILIPGFSRVYYSYRDFAEAAFKKGIVAPMRMFEHWEKQDFDVFACSSGDRFGREQAIFAEVVGRTIDAGAVVFTLRDGEINNSNKRMFVSMAGYQAAVEIDELVRRHKSGNVKRAKRGLPTTSHGLIPSHTTIGRGDQERVIVDENARRLFADIAELLLAGISFRKMSSLLAERGHVRSDGRNYPSETIRGWMMHPTLYGNTAQNFDNAEFGKVRGVWVFDDSELPPSHVKIHYGTHPPMYDSVLGERVKAEIRRRFGANGRSRPVPTRKFSHLVVCDVCHYAAGYKQNGDWRAVSCSSSRNPSLNTNCDNTRYVNEQKLIDFAVDLLDTLASTDDWSALYSEPEKDDTAERLQAVERELAEIDRQAKELMSDRASIPGRFRDQFIQNLNVLDERANTLEVERVRLKELAQDSAPSPSQIQALEDYKQLPPGSFWNLPSLEVNQWLARIMGKRRFVIYDGEVTGTTGKPRRFIKRIRKRKAG